MVDKGVGAEWQGSGLKPPTFDGVEEHWLEWSFVMRASPGGQTAQSQGLLDAAEQRGDPDISNATVLHRIGAEGVDANRKMYFALVMSVKGSAQMIIRGVENQNGALAWRSLVKRYEPATAVRAQSIMTSILNVKQFPQTLAEFEQAHSEWERDIRRYETASGDVFNAGVKKSVFLQKAPKNIRTVLQMQSERSYDELVTTTIQYLQASTVYDDGYQRVPPPPKPTVQRDPNAMKVDALTRAHHKGKCQGGKGDGGKGGKHGSGKGVDGGKGYDGGVKGEK